MLRDGPAHLKLRTVRKVPGLPCRCPRVMVAETGGRHMQCPDCDTPPEADTDDDKSRVVCPGCKRDFGAWGDLKATIFAEAREEARKVFRKR